MPSVSRETVIAAVSEYGLAWTTQDPERIGRLFTEDAVYVERAFDRKATFRGRIDIEKYWTYQVCGKQTNISFRHVESEMVRDADRPIAVVKWLAEFDNRREKRVGDKSNKRVRFCQMAKLFFEGTQIAYLEEYAQGMGGSAVRWPGLEATDEELWAKIRFDPEKPRPSVRCELCSELFPSRTKLFGHLRATQARGDGKPGCVPNAEAAEHNMRHDVLVCFSLTYSCKEPEEHLVRVLEALAVDLDVIDDFIPTLTWAVPPNLTSSAVINVAAAKLPQRFLENSSVDVLMKRLNETMAMLSYQSKNAAMLRIHTLGLVDRLFAPERREFEKYAAFVPWTLLQTQTPSAVMEHHPTSPSSPEKEPIANDEPSAKQWHKPLESTTAYKFVTLSLAQRIKHGARIMSDNLTNVRIRTSTMSEPWHRWCRISLSMRQQVPGSVEQLTGLLLAYARLKLTEKELITSLVEALPQAAAVAEPFPSEFVCLMEPFLSRYETKTGLSLCSHSTDASDDLKTSVCMAEQATLQQMESKEHLLERWAL